MSAEKTFTPALGNAHFTPLYDLAIAALTRENLWRSRLVAHINPAAEDRILDVGCGTGSLAIRLKKTAPDAEILGIDPDPAVIVRAWKKSEKLGVTINWRIGFLTPALCEEIGQISKAVSCLVLKRKTVSFPLFTHYFNPVGHFILRTMDCSGRSLCAFCFVTPFRRSMVLLTPNPMQTEYCQA